MKCAKCGLMQSRNPQCKRCGSPLAVGSPYPVRAAAPASEPELPPLLDNPYAPPVASSSSGYLSEPEGELYRDGKILIARDGAPFPDRCVRCNQPAEGFRLKKTFYWHAQGWYLLILVNVIVYAVVAMAVRKKATIEVPLCPGHRKRRRVLIGLALTIPVATFFIGLMIGGDLFALFLIIAFLLAVVLGLTGAQLLTPSRIEDDWAYLKGAHQEFLARLPIAT